MDRGPRSRPCRSDANAYANRPANADANRHANANRKRQRNAIPNSGDPGGDTHPWHHADPDPGPDLGANADTKPDPRSNAHHRNIGDRRAIWRCEFEDRVLGGVEHRKAQPLRGWRGALLEHAECNSDIPTRGKANVYVDGRFVRTVDLHASRFHGRPLALFNKNWSGVGAHTLTIKVARMADQSIVAIDAFTVRR